MLDQTTLSHLRALKLLGLADAFQQQLAQPEAHAMAFEERLALLVDREINHRADRKRTRLLQAANLKYPNATVEEAEFTDVRGIDRKTLTNLALSGWIERGDTILFSGATGLGKTWLACALAQYACQRGHSARYLRMPRLAEELRVLHGAGSFGKWLLALAKTDVLVLDDWGTGSLDPTMRSDLLEIIDDRAARRATIITHQLLIEHWHGWIGDATIADASSIGSCSVCISSPLKASRAAPERRRPPRAAKPSRRLDRAQRDAQTRSDRGCAAVGLHDPRRRIGSGAGA